MNNLQSQYRQIQKAATLDSVLVDTEALNIFCPNDTPASLEEMLATICRNLIRYYFHCMEHEVDSGNESYLLQIQSFELTGKTDTKLCFQLAEQLPAPPEFLPEKIHHIYRTIGEVLKIRGLSPEQSHIRLYEITTHWSCSLQSFQTVPASLVLDDALKFCFQHQKRHENMNSRSIRWGEEYDSCLQKYLQLGYRPKTAKTAAKQDFIKAHPLPKTADEQLEAGEFPGHSNPALRRYRQAYLNSKR